MLNEKQLHLYKHEMLSITAGLEAAMDILIEEIIDNENEMAILYQNKIEKLNSVFNSLLIEADIKI